MNTRGLFLDYPFDQLFDRVCRLDPWDQREEVVAAERSSGRDAGKSPKSREKEDPLVPAIKLPSKEHPGTGNIVICGPPGSGKSNLALEIAVKCAMLPENQSNAVYYSLENSIPEVIAKAKSFGWDKWLREMRLLEPVREPATAEDLAPKLSELLLGHTSNIFLESAGQARTIDHPGAGVDLTRRVLLGGLTPRSLDGESDHVKVFARRYAQIERLLAAAELLTRRGEELSEARPQTQPPLASEWVKTIQGKVASSQPNVRALAPVVLPLIVIDSLNTFGMRNLAREEVLRLFSLFRKYRRIGVVVVESSQETPFDSTIADVVISLTAEEDRGYRVRHFEIQKSRFYNQVDGRHPYKCLAPASGEDASKARLPMIRGGGKFTPPRSGVVIYPSLHYLVLRTERTLSRGANPSPPKWLAGKISEPNYFGITAFETLLPRNLARPSVIALEGPRKTFKTSIALNFLAAGLREGESAMLIRLSDIPLLKYDTNSNALRPPRVSEDLAKHSEMPFDWSGWRREMEKEIDGGYWSVLAAPHKMSVTVWRKERKKAEGTLNAADIRAPRRLLTQLLQKLGPNGWWNNPDVLSRLGALDCLPDGPEQERELRHELAKIIGTMLACPVPSPELVQSEKRLSKKVQRHAEAYAKMNAVQQARYAGIINRLLLAGLFPAEVGLVEPTLFELDFKGGMLLPEEFIDIIRNVFVRREGGRAIRRVVLHDVGQIGVCYPFLQHSLTTGEIFLPAFVHIMRNFGVDLLMVGTTGGLGSADHMVSQACALADTVVSSRFLEVFGERHVVLTGEGLSAGSTEVKLRTEEVPAVVFLEEQGTRFRVDPHYLEGLVGFQTGRIHRPGVTVYVFEDNCSVHRDYNHDIATMLRTGLAAPIHCRRDMEPESGAKRTAVSDPSFASADVVVQPFPSIESEAVHDALKLLPEGAPRDRTVLLTVDEFGAPAVSSTDRTGQTAEYFMRIGGDEGGGRHASVKRGTSRNPGTLHRKDFIFFAPPAESTSPETPISCSEASAGRTAAQPPASNSEPLWPYYANVLLMAFRRDLDGNDQAVASHSLRQQPGSWTDALSFAKAHGTQLDGGRMFWVDLSATETLSCFLLDALATGDPCGTDETSARDYWNRVLKRSPGADAKLSDEQVSELAAVSELCYGMGELDKESKRKLPENAAVYVCWYSQLRDLIHRHPELSTKLDVCPLPGGGFKGDWFLGVVEGSVSPALGQRLVETLCSSEQDYNRYVRGVGLPARREFYESLENTRWFGWPRGEHVTLERLREIYNRAWSRRLIDDYPQFRSVLYPLAHQLTPLAGPGFIDSSERRIHVRNIVGRLFNQLRVLAPGKP